MSLTISFAESHFDASSCVRQLEVLELAKDRVICDVFGIIHRDDVDVTSVFGCESLVNG